MSDDGDLSQQLITSGRPHRRAKPQLVRRQSLDGRSNAAKFFDRLVREIETDLGGADQLSTIEKSLIEAFVGGRLSIDNFNTRLLSGEQIDIAAFSATASAMVRISSRLGVRRRPRNVNPSLADILAAEDRRKVRGNEDTDDEVVDG